MATEKPKKTKQGNWWDDFVSNLGSAFGQSAVGGRGRGMAIGSPPSIQAPRTGPNFEAPRRVASNNRVKGIDALKQSRVRQGRGGGASGAVDASSEEMQGYDRMTFLEALEQARQMMGGGSDYDALEGQLRQNGSEGDSRLEAMYRQLRGSIDADAPGIQSSYGQAATAQNANADNAVSNVRAGYDDAQAQQMSVLKALGISDAEGVLMANGNLAGQDQGDAIANIEQNRAANVGQTEANKASAINYNTNISNASGLEGAQQRAALQQQLASKLAELQVAEQEESAQREQSVFSNALGLYDRDTAEFDRYNDQQQSMAEFIAEQQQNQLKQATGSQSKQAKYYAEFLKQFKDPVLAKEYLQGMIDAGMI